MGTSQCDVNGRSYVYDGGCGWRVLTLISILPDQKGLKHHTYGSYLPKELWAEAAVAQVHTRNLLPLSRHPNTIPKEVWTGRHQHVDHLCPWGCLAWAKVPEELIRSKLDPRSVKARLVGYANSGYRLYDPRSRTIVTSRDVIFEEGIGHRPLMVLDEMRDDETPHETTLPAPSAPGLLLPHQPVALRIRQGDGPLYPDDTLDHVASDNRALIPAPPARTIPDAPPPPPRRSTRLARPTPALVAAKETLQREQDARENGEEWATDRMPGALLAEGPFSYLSTLSPDDEMGVPKTHKEAMQRPNLWQPAMDEELKVMADRGVFELVDESMVPLGKNVVGCAAGCTRTNLMRMGRS